MKKNKWLLFAWIVSIAATGGSLYFSEILGYPPCEYCWYQRILMYPLTILLGIAYFRNDVAIKFYTLPVAILGIGMAAFHYTIQRFPSLTGSLTCDVNNPCTAMYLNVGGFITIPFLSLIAFAMITIFLVLAKKTDDR